jgi:hypothetical protein
VLRWTYQDVRDALEAIVRCNATDEAYEAAASRGWKELFPGVIFREEILMDATVAREIIKRAKKDDVYKGPVPEDDAMALSEAGELVTMAEQAYASQVRGPEVMTILELAEHDLVKQEKSQNGSESEEADDIPYEPENSSEEATDESESDESTSSDETPSPFRDLSKALAKTEPWETYNDMPVADITSGINQFMESEDPDEFHEILQNVWAFESAHKNRKRILNHVVEAWTKSGGEIEEAPEEQEAPSGDESESVEAQATDTDGGAVDEGDENASDDAGDEVGSQSMEAEISDEAESARENQREGSGGSGSGEQRLIEKIEDELRRERADGIPKPPTETLPDLPWEWGEISNEQLQNYHMQYAAWAFYKSYQRTKHERVAIHARQAAEELTHKKRLEISNYDDHNKEKKVGLIEAEIAQDETIKRWRRMQAKYDRMSISARQELDALHKMVESLSRLETMRMNSWERSRK